MPRSLRFDLRPARLERSLPALDEVALRIAADLGLCGAFDELALGVLARRGERRARGAREQAERHARRDGLEFVPSFHPDLVLGVATYALELLRYAPDLDILYVPIGQGSGICGCILARDLLGLTTEIVGVQSAEAPS